MRDRIIVLFDSESMRRESLQYSIELAKRMNSDLVLLVIISFESGRNASDRIEHVLKRGQQAKASLRENTENIKNAGISVETAVRIGNPKSELVKYLAEAGRFEIIVWGARPNLMKRKDHWLARIKDVLECPVVTPFLKNDANTTDVKEQRH